MNAAGWAETTWVLQNDNVPSAITGASRPDQVAGNAQAADHRLSAETMAGIDQVLAAPAALDPSLAGAASEVVVVA